MSIRALCPHCDTVSRYSGEWQGRQLRCGNPQCGKYFVAEHVIEEPGAPQSRPSGAPAAPMARPVAQSPARAERHDSDEPPLAKPVAASPAKSAAAPLARPVGEAGRLSRGEAPLARPVEPPLATPVGVPLAAPVPTRPCPRCHAPVPVDATHCTACGTNVETGRRIVTAKPWDKEEEREELRSGWLRLVSLWMPGLFPYASEAPLRRAPLALVAIVVVILVLYPVGRLDWTLLHFATWAGDPSIPRVIPSEEPDGQPIELPVGKFAWYQPITSQFLHGDIEHLIFNLLVLIVFGPKVNDLLGNWGFALAYLGLGAVSDLAHPFECRGQPPTAGLGASGAIMGVAGMYGIFCPQHRVRIVAWFRSYNLTYVLLSLLVGLLISQAVGGGLDQAFAGIFACFGGCVLIILVPLTVTAFLMKLAGNPALNVIVQLFCWPFRVRGLWLVLFFFGMDLLSIFLGAEDNVGHGVHFLGFVVGASIAGLLVATRTVRCGGYDLLTWCYGQEDLAGDLVAEDREATEWATLANRPIVFAVLAVVGVIGFLFFIVSVLDRIIQVMQ